MDEMIKNLLTIIIPCYNGENYLSRCLSSIDSLECEDISFLFINDGSTDSSKNIIEKWNQNHKNAFLINKENGGYSTAINTGLDNCESEYIMFLGVDDEIIPDGLKIVCNQLRYNKPDILAFTTKKQLDDENRNSIEDGIDSITLYKHPGVYYSDIYKLQTIIGDDVGILFTRDTSRCFKREVIGDIRYFGKTGVSSDGCFSSIIACKAHKFEFINEICYCWHMHEDSVSGRKKTMAKMKEEADVWAEYFHWVINNIHKEIPDHIILQYFVYKKLIEKLDEANENEYYIKHSKIAHEFSKYALMQNMVSLKSRLKLTFPLFYNFYKFLIKIRQNRLRLKSL